MSSTQTWGPVQRHVVLASYLGWMLDAFDFFLVVFVFKRIAGDFGTARRLSRTLAEQFF